MKITEEDITRYVIFSGDLDQDVKNYIDAHYNDFQNQIDLCREIMKPLSHEEEKELDKMIDSMFKKSKLFELYPIIDKIIPSQEILTLAAFSAELKSKIETLSFTDHDNQLIVRVIKEGDEHRLYLFLLEENKSASYRVTLYPSGETIIITDLTKSYKISSEAVSRIIVDIT